MNKGIYPVLSSSIGYETMLSMVTNNLANINTAGYKADRVVFKVDSPETGTQPMNTNTLSFTEVAGIYTDFSEGSIKETGNSLDLAINGEGFFVVNTPDGPRYTRSGNFSLNGANMLSTQDGYPVMGENGPVIIEGGTVTIDPDGRVIIDGEEVNRLRIVDFPKPYDLKKIGNNLFEADGAIPATNYSISQGFLEMSNVDQIKEMVSMIEILRGYESYRKVINAIDETASRTNEIGRV